MYKYFIKFSSCLNNFWSQFSLRNILVHVLHFVKHISYLLISIKKCVLTQLHKSKNVMELIRARIFLDNMAKICFDKFEYYTMS
jgi:hypothetical protein